MHRLARIHRCSESQLPPAAPKSSRTIDPGWPLEVAHTQLCPAEAVTSLNQFFHVAAVETSALLLCTPAYRTCTNTSVLKARAKRECDGTDWIRALGRSSSESQPHSCGSSSTNAVRAASSISVARCDAASAARAACTICFSEAAAARVAGAARRELAAVWPPADLAARAGADQCCSWRSSLRHPCAPCGHTVPARHICHISSSGRSNPG